MKTINVAIFPCGSEAGLEIHNALQHEKNIQLFGASSIQCHGEALYQNYYNELPFIDDGNFEESLNTYLRANKIDYLFPAYDDVIIRLAEIGGALDATPVIPSLEVCNISRSKSLTYEALRDFDFCPSFTTNPNEVKNFPVFSKPDKGQGSQGISLIRSQKELEEASDGNTQLVYCEHLPGNEYTIDCFTDRNGELKVCSTRTRQRVKSGISVRSASIETSPTVKNIAENIISKIPFRGVWFFQLKEDNAGKLKLLEVAPRVAGSMATTRARGTNLPLMSIFDLEGLDINVINNDHPVVLERHLGNRFLQNHNYSTVYVDFDDTITKRGKINASVMMYLYHCVNRSKRIVLITRHEKDIHKTLKELKIADTLFDDIIHILDKSPKSDHINPHEAIFIDDSFSERLDVNTKLGIPVFAVDGVESLIDWRFE